MRKPPQEARPAARAEDSQPSPGEPGRKAGGGQQHGRRVPGRRGHLPGPGLAQGRHRLADDPMLGDHQAPGPHLGERHQRALVVPAQAVGVRLDQHQWAGHPPTAWSPWAAVNLVRSHVGSLRWSNRPGARANSLAKATPSRAPAAA